MAEEHGTMQVFETWQLIFPRLIIITDEFNSLRHQNEFESLSPRTETNLIKIISLIAKGCK